ncbi:thioesterase-like superfamily-domain-containing protein, partial [Pyronema omphalodes]
MTLRRSLCWAVRSSIIPFYKHKSPLNPLFLQYLRPSTAISDLKLQRQNSTMPRPRSASATVKTPPPADPTVSLIENAISLTPLSELGPNVFTNTRPQWQPMGARGIYGGSVIAQCLLAAQLTVPPQFVVHSMHCYFVLAGNSNIPIIYHVDLVRSGRSFHTRTVQAKQRGNVIFTTTLSFTIPLATKFEEGQDIVKVVKHQPKFPSGVKGPEECENEFQVIDRLQKSGRWDEEQANLARAKSKQDAFEFRPVGLSPDLHLPPDTPISSVAPAEKVMRQWVRSKTPIKDPLFFNPALAYVSDSWFIGTVGRVNPDAGRDKVGMMVSLDHTIHFHAGEKTSLDDWLLLETRSSWAGEERGLVRMNVWTQSGELLAQCLQEGMVRLKDGREGTEVQHAASGASTPKELKESAKL